MALIEIDEVVQVPAATEHLAGFSVELPQPESVEGAWWIPISGWVLGRHARVVAVAAVHQQISVRSAPVSLAREDVAAAFPDVPGRDLTGFRMRAGATSLPESFVLRLEAEFENGHRVPFALIRGRRAPLPAAATELSPVVVTALGRSGATPVMALLAEHPQVIVYGGHPFASRPAAYWSHLMRALAEPADLVNSVHPDNFHRNGAWVGAHPFNDSPTTETGEVGEWFGSEYPRSLAEFARSSSQELYQRLARSQGMTGPRFFAEKHEPDALARLTSELYEGAREILVVRDFRDMACSMLACYRSGRVAFGRDQVASDADFMVLLAPAVARLVAYVQERRERMLLVRYEDLIQAPESELQRILDHLALPAGRRDLARMARAAMNETSQVLAHRTAASFSSSIGRFQTDMNDELLQIAEDCFAPGLELFGYALSSERSGVESEELLTR